ncbi:hypothetical protein TVAG_077000 [Trichomonas vaginalis G3]|uniref:Right handed beta helix domain-containing protein n=1 Tax=Trichomonas vaginalis (strain ATCC PRA-98 / G3) TaxID=412133 RepID=A2D9U7_TRIV3|nr:pectin lyase-like family [Trichomonas vaginalis G3]EAY22953.1 hypothetical protein TVAG_077000 [Trichomonas vaginalis G3]KAI5527295.1 pectin lyase-like family [Trichomonas vaginalis G3]|eukprot:XP_001583939.1 hypothetical protein [Trichomonas vaginalis G3]
MRVIAFKRHLEADYPEFDLWKSYYNVELDKFYVYKGDFIKVENLNFQKNGIKFLHSLCMFIYCRSTANGGAITFTGSSSIIEDRFYDEGSINYVQAEDKLTTAHHSYVYLSSSDSYTMNEGCLFNSKFESTNVGGIHIRQGSKTIKYYNCSKCESGTNSGLFLRVSSNAPTISYCNFIDNSAVLDTSCCVASENSGNSYYADHWVMENNTQKGVTGIIETYSTSIYIDNSVILGDSGNGVMFYTSGGSITITNSIVEHYTTLSYNGEFETSNISDKTSNGWRFVLLSPPYMRQYKNMLKSCKTDVL